METSKPDAGRPAQRTAPPHKAVRRLTSGDLWYLLYPCARVRGRAAVQYGLEVDRVAVRVWLPFWAADSPGAVPVLAVWPTCFPGRGVSAARAAACSCVLAAGCAPDRPGADSSAAAAAEFVPYSSAAEPELRAGFVPLFDFLRAFDLLRAFGLLRAECVR